MRVAFFSNQFADGEGHGLARYARELHSAINKLDTGVQLLPVAAWSSLAQAVQDDLVARNALRLLPTGRRMTPILWSFAGRPTLESMLGTSIDVVHAASPGYPIATRKPMVVTVHDLGPLTHPRYFSNTRPWVMERSLRRAIRQGAHFACVSRFAAEELLGHAGPAIADRITVIHEGVSDFFATAPDSSCDGLPVALRGLPPDAPFILAAGKISPRKNIQGVLAAMSELVDRIPHHLVLVGGEGWETESILAQAGKLAARGRLHMPGYVSDEDLRTLYRRASLYVHPSWYEGFGLTVLEAMATGCPVVTANVTSLPEIAGDAARLVAPGDIAGLAAAIAMICSDPAEAARLSSAGYERIKQFRWETCARNMVQLYQRVLEERRSTSSDGAKA